MNNNMFDEVEHTLYLKSKFCDNCHEKNISMSVLFTIHKGQFVVI